MIARWFVRSSMLRRGDVSMNWRRWKRAASQGNDCSVDEIARIESRVVRTILKHTEVTRSHMTPEIRLFLLTANCSLYRESFESVLDGDEWTRSVFAEPFWSIYWPGGQALARYVLDEGRKLFSPSKKGGTSVLDVGAGCGAASIAAKLAGADRVVANDINQVACTATLMNATLNRVDIEVSRENLLHRPLEKPFDVILIGDMLYDEEVSRSLIPWLEDARKGGSRIYLGDPGRHGMITDFKKRLRLLKEYSLPENVRKENYGYDKCGIWEFLGSSIY